MFFPVKLFFSYLKITWM